MHISAQFFDNFSDPDLTENPEWLGDLNYFTVSNEGELWMKYPDEESGSAFIYTKTLIPDSIEWYFYFRMLFAPSASNKLTIFLQLDDPDPNHANGYAISIGETGQNDGIKVFRLENGVQEEIIRAGDGAFADSPASATIKIIRNFQDEWTIYSQLSGDPFFLPIANFFDIGITSSDTSYFGILCDFTKTNRERFFFDDIGISTLMPDNSGPHISSIEFLDFEKIKVSFNEPLLSESISPSNFSLLPFNIIPDSSLLQGIYENEVFLEFSAPLTNGQEYLLKSFDIVDLSGNSANSDFPFQFILPENPEWKDLIISEIGAAPNSAIPLPNGEYFELHNRTDKYISLEDCTVQSGNSIQLLPFEIIHPGEYLIICDDSYHESFQPYGKVLSLASFPSLNNEEDDIVIVNSFGTLIDIIIYKQSWHDNDVLAGIGHSLELVDRGNICSIADNWRTSIESVGGTPGKENSVLGVTAAKVPNILKLFPHSDVSLEITFDQRVDLSGYEGKIEISPENQIIDDLIQSDLIGSSWLIFLSNPIDSGTVYSLTLKDFQDCRNLIESKDVIKRFGIPESSIKGDIIFNEILYDPHIDGSEYLEFYCKSESILDASKIYLRVHSSSGSINSRILGLEKLIFPGDYITICKDPLGVLDYYSVENPNNLWITELPSLTSEGASLSLWSDSGNGLIMIDSFHYTPSMHSPLLSNTKGISLERISPNSSSTDNANWYSASPITGGGTPTFKNSQYPNEVQERRESPFKLQVETFSPDWDGHDDRMIISYQFEDGDKVISTSIYNLDAHPIRKLDDIPVSGSSGYIYWDGLMQDGRIAPSGVYIVKIETFSPNGNTNDFHYSVILATKE